MATPNPQDGQRCQLSHGRNFLKGHCDQQLLPKAGRHISAHLGRGATTVTAGWISSQNTTVITCRVSATPADSALRERSAASTPVSPTSVHRGNMRGCLRPGPDGIPSIQSLQPIRSIRHHSDQDSRQLDLSAVCRQESAGRQDVDLDRWPTERVERSAETRDVIGTDALPTRRKLSQRLRRTRSSFPAHQPIDDRVARVDADQHPPEGLGSANLVIRSLGQITPDQDTRHHLGGSDADYDELDGLPHGVVLRPADAGSQPAGLRSPDRQGDALLTIRTRATPGPGVRSRAIDYNTG